MPEARLVSVIVNNCSYAAFLREAVDSALGQTYRHVEVIVVDDGSTDQSRQIIAGYGERVVAVLKENGGQASAFNAGFARSRGEVVVFLDADDVLLSTAVERVLPYFEDAVVVKVHWPLWVIDEKGERTGEVLPRQSLAEGDLSAVVIRDGPDSYQGAPTSGNAWSRSLLSRLLPAPEPEYRNGADGYLLTLSPLFGQMRAVGEPLGFYRVHGRNHYWCAATDERISRSLLRYERRAVTLRQQLAAQGIEASPEEWRRRNPYYAWMDRLNRATEELKAVIPPGENFLLVDECQWGADVLTDRRALPFPEKDGYYAGPPPDDETAIAELERLRGGATFLVFGWPAFWWLDHYAGLTRHVRSQLPCVLENDRLVVFALRNEGEGRG